MVCYALRLLSKAEHNYCVTCKELLAVVTFLEHFRQYLLGHCFTICTDHGALTWLQNFKEPQGQLTRWLEKPQEYQFCIVHRPGRLHNNADALSRIPCKQCGRDSHMSQAVVATLTSSTIVCGYSHEGLRQMQAADSCISETLKAKERDLQPSPEYAKGQSIASCRLLQQWDQLMVHDGVLWRYYAQPLEEQAWWQLVVPKELQEAVLTEVHEGISGGHLEKDKTFHHLKERFYWSGHYNNVQEWCSTCASCATRKSNSQAARAPLGTIRAGYSTQIIAVDLVGPLPESENKNSYIMVVGDYYTRWMEAFPLPNQEVTTVTEKLMDEVFLRFSVPEQLHADQGRQFESQLMSEVCKLLGIHKTRTTPYHPQSDGLMERFNRTMLNMLAACAKDNPFDWEKHIRKICMECNSSVQASTGFAPFYLMFGWRAKLPVDIIYGTSRMELVEWSQSPTLQ